MTTGTVTNQFGKLAEDFCGIRLPITVLQSAAGFYLGTLKFDEDCQCDMPYSRESNEYWPTSVHATDALHSGQWTQKRSL